MKSIAIRVRREESEKILRIISRYDILRKDLKAFERDGYVHFPVIKNIPELEMYMTESDFQERPEKGIREILVRELGEKGMDIGWQRIGDAVIFNAGSGINEDICREICQRTGAGQIYEIDGKIEGDIRKPELIPIYGNPHDTIYRENGVNFVLNPSRVMLSKGNISERGIPYFNLIRPENVLDMFSGIGYFSLPLGRKFQIRSMTCIDLNPISLEYLKKSYEKSNFTFDLTLRNMDCRNFSSDEKFDFILMGNFKSFNYLPHALKHSSSSADIVLHHLESSDSMVSSLYEILRKCKLPGYRAWIRDSHRVKSYAPHMWHISTLIHVERKRY